MKRTIEADLYRYDLHGFKGLMRAMLIPGFRYMYFFRKSETARNVLSRLYYKWMLRKLGYKYGFQIPVGTSIGEGFYIGHHGHVIINPGAVIGRNCSVSPGVTIGQDNRGAKRGTPVLGNKVWIGTNAVIVGKITIGDDVLIVPNSFVNFDVPSHSVVIGHPAKIIPRENATEGFISFTIDDRLPT